jgi:acyl CoA:acetate/3-ketoacid CoA transferase beta subunit
MTDHTPTEMMTVAAARALRKEDVCFVGIGMPSAAANLARLTHAPDIVLIYESGTLGTRPSVLPLSIGDGELCETALTTVSVPEMFRYWLQGGRISVCFLGGAPTTEVVAIRNRRRPLFTPSVGISFYLQRRVAQRGFVRIDGSYRLVV